MTKEELALILEKHKKWLNDDPDGKRADLRGANLRCASLSDADLSGADLRDADLRGADIDFHVYRYGAEAYPLILMIDRLFNLYITRSNPD